MLHVVLVEPEIPSNTGNIARTCAAIGVFEALRQQEFPHMLSQGRMINWNEHKEEHNEL